MPGASAGASELGGRTRFARACAATCRATRRSRTSASTRADAGVAGAVEEGGRSSCASSHAFASAPIKRASPGRAPRPKRLAAMAASFVNIDNPRVEGPYSLQRPKAGVGLQVTGLSARQREHVDRVRAVRRDRGARGGGQPLRPQKRLGIDDGDILLAGYGVRDRARLDRRAERLRLPKDFARLGVEGAQHLADVTPEQ